MCDETRTHKNYDAPPGPVNTLPRKGPAQIYHSLGSKCNSASPIFPTLLQGIPLLTVVIQKLHWAEWLRLSTQLRVPMAQQTTVALVAMNPNPWASAPAYPK